MAQVKFWRDDAQEDTVKLLYLSYSSKLVCLKFESSCYKYHYISQKKKKNFFLNLKIYFKENFESKLWSNVSS